MLLMCFVPSRNSTKVKYRVLSRVGPRFAAFRAPKEAAPILLLLRQKKKQGVNVVPIVDAMMKVAKV